MKNFPYKCFFNDETKAIYSFYRQGDSLIINSDNASEYRHDRMTELDLGQMFLVYNKALIARSSGDIVFFKREMVEPEDGIGAPIKKWK